MKAGAGARGAGVYSSPRPAIKAGPGPEPVHRRLAGPLNQNGPSGLFLAFLLSLSSLIGQSDRAAVTSRALIDVRFIFFIFFGARPSGRVLVDPGPRARPPRPELWCFGFQRQHCVETRRARQRDVGPFQLRRPLSRFELWR